MIAQGITLWSVTWALVAILVTCSAVTFWKRYRAMRFFEKNNIPYRKPLPIFGSVLPMLMKKTSFADFMIDLYTEFPDAKYSGVFEFGNPVYILRDPELIKSIMVKNFDHFPDHKELADESIDPLLGSNLFSIKGERWKEMRSIISPAFTSSKMRAMFELTTKCAEDFTDYLEKQPRPLCIEMKDIFTRCIIDVIATSAFGVSVNSLVNRENEFYMMAKDATNFGWLRAVKIFLLNWIPTIMKILKLKFLTAEVSDFFCGIVRDTIEKREKEGITRPDLIHQLMQARHKGSNEKLTIDEITAQAFIFFLAGFETSSSLMCFACHQLAVHPDLQDRLVTEIDEAFEEDGKLSYEKVNHLQYLEMFMNETLRYYPPAVSTDRVSARTFELPPANDTAKPVLATPGTRLWIPIVALHRNPDYFPDPDKFDPERFSPDNKGSINHSAFIPFGAGPRNCPANRFGRMGTKLILCSMLRKFNIRTGAKTHIPLVLNKSSLVMTSEYGFWLDLEPRNATTIGR